MDALPRAIVIAAIILGGAFIVRGLYPADRFTMVAAPGGAFRVDRLTGAVLFCDAVICRALPVATFAAPPAKPAAQPRPPTASTGT
jgi:hypothetical protein